MSEDPTDEPTDEPQWVPFKVPKEGDPAPTGKNGKKLWVPKFWPCPFCGSEDIRMLPQENGFSVDCQHCRAWMREITKFPQQMAAAWNRRPKTDKFLLTFEFDNPKIRENFAKWLADNGEQVYWEWMEAVEKQDPDPMITAVDFNYHGPPDPPPVEGAPKKRRRYRGFIPDNIVRTTGGRTTEDDEDPDSADTDE